ncbi:hypothetical protein [Azospirillum soli]|uniref:hypothetical protein n=1 Tax=Azospirillum soli TaxID=1304799 RepID=UPI001AE6E35F|nr:hypothetical protein [Azospirillum soli]MBP2311323.1 hypothetical protein [Azospirillum soli]
MLHIKDIEAFAHINEALASDSRAETAADDHRPAAHPALLLAMVATGRLQPEEPGGERSEEAEVAHHRHASLAGMMARMLGVRRG